MKHHRVDKIAHALLYEGYILYPYRPSMKNRQRWTFGGLYPKSYSDAQNGTDPWIMQMQCLVRGTPESTVDVTLRFLHLMLRTVYDSDSQPVPSIQVDGKQYDTWQEATEREISVGTFRLADLLDNPQRRTFTFPAQHQIEPIANSAGSTEASLIRQQLPIQAGVEVSAVKISEDIFRLTVRIENQTVFNNGDSSRDDALLRTFASTHILLQADAADFISMTDPPSVLKEAAANCSSIGCWPILVGLPGDTSTVLASPIILSDYPEIAPESPGDLFDGGEIDEILTLRILTLTDEEKLQMASVDDRTRALLARTESLGREQLYALHATMRSPEKSHA
jgi:hypothetical protein